MNKVGGITLPDIKNYCLGTVMKIVLYSWMGGHIYEGKEQRNHE